MGFIRHHLNLIGYFILSVGVILALIGLRETQSEVDRQARIKLHLLCEDNNDTKRAVTGMLRVLFIDQEPDLPQAELEHRDQRIQALEEGILAPRDCPAHPDLEGS